MMIPCSRNLLTLILFFVFTVGTVQATPIIYEGSLSNGNTVYDNVPFQSYDYVNQWDFWSTTGTAGDIVSIALTSLNGQMDPYLVLYSGLGVDNDGLYDQVNDWLNPGSDDGYLTLLTFDNDSGLGWNSYISDYVLPHTGYYSVVAFDNWGLDAGPWVYALTIDGFTPIPEPSTFLLLGGGLAGLAFAVRRKRQRIDTKV